jgi:hypothetical protein
VAAKMDADGRVAVERQVEVAARALPTPLLDAARADPVALDAAYEVERTVTAVHAGAYRMVRCPAASLSQTPALGPTTL